MGLCVGAKQNVPMALAKNFPCGGLFLIFSVSAVVGSCVCQRSVGWGCGVVLPLPLTFVFMTAWARKLC